MYVVILLQSSEAIGLIEECSKDQEPMTHGHDCLKGRHTNASERSVSGDLKCMYASFKCMYSCHN